MKHFLPLAALLFFSFSTYSQAVLTAIDSPYSQNFDTLASSPLNSDIPFTSNSTLIGWYITRPVYWAGSGTATAGTFFSFGSSTGSTERAFGSIAVTSTGTLYSGLRLKNQTGVAITSLDITFTGEQWRKANNSAVQILAFGYMQSAIADDPTAVFTPASQFDFASPIASATTGTALNGNLAANRTLISGTLTVSIPPGEEIMLRWADANDANEDHGLAIDDLTVIPRGNVVPTLASVSGRLLRQDGRPVPFARVVLIGGQLAEPRFAITNHAGVYRFIGVPTGQEYTVFGSSKRVTFSPGGRTLTLTGDLTGFDLTAK
ncbi:MAG: carboxypeptidase-like regulatory domain-containing protein [Pyrinomonadaceae bacterium]|nr:carboxypeptidase-like regulatory domain-containing protein [Pyrinomonadaceae bacterium]